jgi:hypothetical protein
LGGADEEKEAATERLANKVKKAHPSVPLQSPSAHRLYRTNGRFVKYRFLALVRPALYFWLDIHLRIPEQR